MTIKENLKFIKEIHGEGSLILGLLLFVVGKIQRLKLRLKGIKVVSATTSTESFFEKLEANKK